MHGDRAVCTLGRNIIMAISEAFMKYVYEQIPLATDANVAVIDGDDAAHFTIDIDGDNVHALYIANGIHKLLCNISDVDMSDDATSYNVIFAYSSAYCPVDVGQPGEYHYQIPVEVQYTAVENEVNA